MHRLQCLTLFGYRLLTILSHQANAFAEFFYFGI